MFRAARATSRLGTALFLLAAVATASNSEQIAAEAARALEAGELATARAGFEDALDKDPSLTPAWLGLAAVAEAEGDTVGALALARRAVTLAPDQPTANLTVARLLTRLGKSEEALSILDRTRELAPDQAEPYVLSALALRQLEDDEATKRAIELLRTACELPAAVACAERSRLLLAAGATEQAVEVAQTALARFPDTGALHLALGLALGSTAASGDHAILALERALELGAGNTSAVRLELARLLEEAGQKDRALAQLRAAVELAPNSPEAHYRLATALRAAGEPEQARQSLELFRRLAEERDAADRNEKELGTALNEAQSLVAENRLTDAVDRLRSLIERWPESPRAYALAAKVLFSMRQAEPALEAIQRACRLDPKAVEYHFLAGMFLMDLKRPTDASSALERALAIDPRQAEAHALLGTLAADAERPQKAATHFQQALDLGAESPALRLRYAQILSSLGREEESAQQMAAYRRLADG